MVATNIITSTHKAMASPKGTALKADVAEILPTLDLLLEPGQVAELRVINTQQGTVFGYFTEDSGYRAAPERPIAWPETNEATGDRRYCTVPTISSGKHRRPIGTNDDSLRRWLSVASSCIPAGTKDGHTELMVICFRANSGARRLTVCSKDALPRE